MVYQAHQTTFLVSFPKIYSKQYLDVRKSESCLLSLLYKQIVWPQSLGYSFSWWTAGWVATYPTAGLWLTTHTHFEEHKKRKEKTPKGTVKYIVLWWLFLFKTRVNSNQVSAQTWSKIRKASVYTSNRLNPWLVLRRHVTISERALVQTKNLNGVFGAVSVTDRSEAGPHWSWKWIVTHRI